LATTGWLRPPIVTGGMSEIRIGFGIIKDRKELDLLSDTGKIENNTE
jgi:hypothetical protein